MTQMICKTIQLDKRYKKQDVLCDINIEIKRGEIYGLIGENGAGKTTLMKIISGLSFATDGELELFEKKEPHALVKSRRKIGCMIEGPALNLNLTAYQNLNAHRIQQGIPGTTCIKDVMKKVNLEEVGHKKVKHFSLGMKQRLGLAIALLSDPQLLILDEPINGLDPTGMIEFRDILMKLNTEQKTTIIISSHILSELHKLATSYGIIHQGKLLQQLTAQVLDEKCKKHIYLKIEQTDLAICLLEKQLGIKQYEVLPHQCIKIYEALDQSKEINKLLAEHELYAEEITVRGDSLESYFSKVIGGQLGV